MRLSLSSWILIGAVLGLACGLFFGEYATVLSVVGDAFVGLLQMTVLPYIAIAIIANIGKLSPSVARRFGLYVCGFLFISVIITLAAIVLLPLCLPARETASFFSSSTLAESTQFDFLQLFIPSNPFYSLANNIVPAVVLFCIAIGAAIMNMETKKPVLEQLDFLSKALARINKFLVKLTPIGVFAIIASIAGTMHLDELSNLKAYVIMNLVASLVLGYGVLLVLLAALTPFSYRDLFKVSRAPVITAFMTGKVFIVLPMLIESAEELFSKQFDQADEAISNVRAITPLVYPFPHAGKLLALIFVPFAAWFVDIPMTLEQYPALLSTGLFSLFGSPLVAMPFLLNMFQLPADMFQLFIASGLLVSRFGDLLGVIHLFFVSVLTATALSGKLILKWRKLLPSIGIIFLIVILATLSTKAYLTSTFSEEYKKDEIVRNMHSAIHSSPAVIHRSLPKNFPALEVPALERLANKGVLRIGYHSDNLPMSFFNASNELVGHDIDVAHLLAEQLGCRLEFVPFEFSTLVEQLNRGDFDIAMSGIAMLPTRLTQMTFSNPYMHATAAILIPDYRREEFIRRIAESDFRGIRFAFARSGDISKIAATLLPEAKFLEVSSLREYCESGGKQADGMIWSAESGSAWTLLYPNFSVVPIRPLYRVPVGFAVSHQNKELAEFVSRWLMIFEAGPADEQLYDHWILGKNAQRNEPRWSVIKDVLHWVE